MRWIGWSLAALIAFAAVVGGAWIGRVTTAQAMGRDDRGQREAPYRVSLHGAALSARIGRDLLVVNVARSEGRSRRPSRVVILERVSFERSAGAVVARGSIHDMGAPRILRAVVDGYGADGAYLSSGASMIQSAEGSSAFSASMADRDEFATFAVRFLDAGGSEVRMRTPDEPAQTVPPLLVEDGLNAVDFQEVGLRLQWLGYVEDAAKVVGDVPVTVVVRRFRKDHGLQGPGFVTVGDLLALRAVSAGARVDGGASVDLSSY